MSENNIPQECPYCDAEGTISLDKYPQTMLWQGKQVQIERWSCRCGKCGTAFEPAWMFQQNLDRIRQAHREAEVAK